MAKYSFSPNDVAAQIATALSILTDTPVGNDQVIVEPTEYAGRYLITVYDSPQAASAVIPLLDAYGSIPTSIGELCTIGYRTNRKPQGMSLRQHGILIGGTTSGKSNALHVMLAHALRCPDCFVWVGSKWKLYDFVFPYIEPFLNTEFPSPLDWVAHGQQDIVNMMAAFLEIGKYRMNLRYDERENLPTGILVLDEVTYTIKDKHTKAMWDGKLHNADSLLSDNVRGNAEPDLWTWGATQHDTMFNLGDDGGTVGAQMMFKFIFAIGDYQSAGRVTNDFSLSLPTHPGECWARLGLTSPLFKLRVPYAQKPNKERLHNGPTLLDIAWNRRSIPHKLDAGSADAAGEHYANRHGPMVTEEYIKYLRSDAQTQTAATTSKDTGSAPSFDVGGFSFSKEELADAEEQFNQMMREASGALPASNGNGNGNGLTNTVSTAVDSQPTTLKHQVFDVVKSSGEPLGRADIIEALSARGIAVRNVNTVTNICGVYCKDGQMAKTDDDRYYTP